MPPSITRSWSEALSRRLASASERQVTAFALITGFSTYFAMYGFRKAFTAATFEDMTVWGMDMKTLLILAQLLGYMSSKFAGIRLIASQGRHGRAIRLLLLIGLSHVALLAFAVLPTPWKPVALFLNGFPLGLIWGIVFSYMEGRRSTEILGTTLCVSFIVSSGAARSVAGFLMLDLGVPELWMPFVTGLAYLPLIALSALLLDHTPAPSASDVAQRHERQPMDAADRRRARGLLFPVLLVLVAFYTALTAFRDLRDNFSAELWTAMGYGGSPAVFTLSELPVALLVIAMLWITGKAADNRKALGAYHRSLAGSMGLLFLATLAFRNGHLVPEAWMVLSGAALYTAYIPFNGVFFDRLLGSFRLKGNAGFLVYIADAYGYLGSAAILFFRHFGEADLPWTDFISLVSLSIGALGLLASGLSWAFLSGLFHRHPDAPDQASIAGAVS
jgi:hypothetical protein